MQKSLTDTEYAGGIIFKQLVEEGTIVPFDGDVQKQNAILFTLDKYCYLGKTTAPNETRAYLLVDQMTTIYNAKVHDIELRVEPPEKMGSRNLYIFP